MLVSTGASYDASHEGRTHQAPEDVAAVAALPGWTIHVPGHVEEMESLLRKAFATDERVYLRLTEETNHARADGDGRLVVLRRGSPGAPLALAVGPTLRPVLEATADLDVTVAYLTTVRPFPHTEVRDALGDGEDVVLVEPYLRGTSSAEVSAALEDKRAPPARARRRERGVPPLRHGRRAPRGARTRRRGDPRVARPAS